MHDMYEQIADKSRLCVHLEMVDGTGHTHTCSSTKTARCSAGSVFLATCGDSVGVHRDNGSPASQCWRKK